MIDNILKFWTRIEAVLIGLLILTALCTFLGSAVVRAVAPAWSIDWGEEIALYCIVWATVLAGSSLVTEGRHIRTEIFVASLAPSLRSAAAWLVLALSAGFCLAMAWHGWKAFGFSLMLDERSASTLRTPQAYAVTLAMPVGMALILGRVALMLAAGRRPFTDEPTPEGK